MASPPIARLCVELTFCPLVYHSCRYFSLPPEERARIGLADPMCELFPKQVGCYYSRYGLGGGLDSRHGMCILGLNMINDKVFLIIWVWHYFMLTMGCIRVVTRLGQVLSSTVRLFLIRIKMHKYFKKNAHTKHIQHYLMHCSIGDWFVLYQMSKNLNTRFFAEFLALLAMTVDPDPNIEPEEPEIHLTEADIEKLRDAGASSSSSKKNEDSSSGEEEEEEGSKSLFAKLDEGLDGGGAGGGDGGGGLSGKERNLIKLGKHAKSANKKAMMAAAAMRRKR